MHAWYTNVALYALLYNSYIFKLSFISIWFSGVTLNGLRPTTERRNIPITSANGIPKWRPNWFPGRCDSWCYMQLKVVRHQRMCIDYFRILALLRLVFIGLYGGTNRKKNDKNRVDKHHYKIKNDNQWIQDCPRTVCHILLKIMRQKYPYEEIIHKGNIRLKWTIATWGFNI